MRNSSEGYKFMFNGNTVTAVYEVENGRMELERIDRDETWSFDGTYVTKTEWDDGRLETTTYVDVNSDGLFFKTAKIYSETGSKSGGSNDHGSLSGGAPSSGAVLSMEEGYRFDVDTNGSVTAVYELEDGRVEVERIDANETWKLDGADVIQTEAAYGKVETSIYADANGDGVFQKAFELEVLNGANRRTLETYKFTLSDGATAKGTLVDEDSAIKGMKELGSRGWKVDRIDANETLQVVVVDGDALILQVKTQRNEEIDFSVFRDDDNDGLWTEIADGQTSGAYLKQDGSVDLIGIAQDGLLHAADNLMG